MVFKLEALQADFGDSLILHYGDEASPKYILIDGGPKGVYQGSLRERLEELRADEQDEQLSLQMVMVSHIDGDHITGIIALTDELIQNKIDKEKPPYKIVRLWHNSFDDFIDTDEVNVLSAALSPAIKAAEAGSNSFASLGVSPGSLAVVADVGQGRTLRENAVKLSLQPNKPFDNIVLAPETGKETVDMGNGLTFTVIAPNKKRIEELQTEWDIKLKKLKLAKSAKDAETEAAAFLDKSVANLSSIVVLAEADGKSMLLTGDARGDDVLRGLNSAGLLEDGKIHVDLLKLPHHGSDRNVATSFFRAVTADHYVISADGTNDNPDLPTLKMISEARGQDNFTIHLTNKEDRLVDFFAEDKNKGKKYKVVFRDPNELSLQIDLGG